LIYTYIVKSHQNPRKAQAGLEYLGIAALVMAGILIAGPYVVRSINAHFKAAENGAIDTEREKIRQAPLQPENLPTCTCNWSFGGCGNGGILDNGEACGVGRNIFKRMCSPLGCEVQMQSANVFSNMQECRDDPTNAHNCCTAREDKECGALGANTPGGACPDGQIKWVQNCGSPTPKAVYHCSSDNRCIFGCAAKSTTATWCNSSKYNDNVISNNQAVRYVTFGQCNADNDMTCKAQCPKGSFAIGH
jgi:hypothetical protein